MSCDPNPAPASPDDPKEYDAASTRALTALRSFIVQLENLEAVFENACAQKTMLGGFLPKTLDNLDKRIQHIADQQVDLVEAIMDWRAHE